MRNFALTTLTLLLFTACTGSSMRGGAQGHAAYKTYDVALTVEPNVPHKLRFEIMEPGTTEPANLTDRMLHTLLLPADLSTLYHEHPRQVRPGVWELNVGFLETSGEYDIWLEIAGDDQHTTAFYKRFTHRLGAATTVLSSRYDERVTLAPRQMEVAAPGFQSSLGFTLSLDGQPVAGYNKFMGVAVHSFAVSRDRTVLLHDHAQVLPEGGLNAHFVLPHAGDYVLFLEPTIKVGSKGQIRRLVRYEFEVPA